MNEQPPDSRRQAARNFANALDELETVLQSEPPESSSDQPSSRALNRPPSAPTRHPTQANIATADRDFGELLEEAVQDIEQFMTAEEPPPDD